MTPADISVVIPTLNEAECIGSAIGSARAAGATDVIVSDGGSQDDTVEEAKRAGAAKVVRSIPGRGIQLNSGITFAEKTFILFLHADNRLDPQCLQQICDRGEVVWGAFVQHIDSPRSIYRWLERGNAWRVRLRKLPFGDQAIFVRRDVLKKQGGFAEIPLMEDVELSCRLKRVCRPTLLPGPVTISPRRWQRRGVLRQTLLNWSLQIRYACGASPERLAERYR